MAALRGAAGAAAALATRRGPLALASVPRAARSFASPPAISDPVDSAAGAAAASAASAAPPAAAAAPAAAGPKPASSSSSAWSRLTAVLTGVGVSAVYMYYTLGDDLAKSNAAVDASLAAFKRDATATSAELRSRVATLEHRVAALKQ